MRPNPTFRSLWRPILWTGMERIPGALWILLILMLVVMGLMLAGDYIATVLIVAAGTVGTVYLRKIAEKDPQLFRVWFRRLPHKTAYPARRTRIASAGGTRTRNARPIAARSGRAGKKPGSQPGRGGTISAKLRAGGRRLQARLVAIQHVLEFSRLNWLSSRSWRSREATKEASFEPGSASRPQKGSEAQTGATEALSGAAPVGRDANAAAAPATLTESGKG